MKLKIKKLTTDEALTLGTRALTKAYPGVFFSLSASGPYRDEVTVEWIDGPTPHEMVVPLAFLYKSSPYKTLAMDTAVVAMGNDYISPVIPIPKGQKYIEDKGFINWLKVKFLNLKCRFDPDHDYRPSKVVQFPFKRVTITRHEMEFK